MVMHATYVNARTLDFLQQVNGGVRPEIESQPTVLVYADNLNDPHNEILTIEDFESKYEFCANTDCIHDKRNCNVVTKK